MLRSTEATPAQQPHGRLRHTSSIPSSSTLIVKNDVNACIKAPFDSTRMCQVYLCHVYESLVSSRKLVVFEKDLSRLLNYSSRRFEQKHAASQLSTGQ